MKCSATSSSTRLECAASNALAPMYCGGLYDQKQRRVREGRLTRAQSRCVRAGLSGAPFRRSTASRLSLTRRKLISCSRWKLINANSLHCCAVRWWRSAYSCESCSGRSSPSTLSLWQAGKWLRAFSSCCQGTLSYPLRGVRRTETWQSRRTRRWKERSEGGMDGTEERNRVYTASPLSSSELCAKQPADRRLRIVRAVCATLVRSSLGVRWLQTSDRSTAGS